MLAEKKGKEKEGFNVTYFLIVALAVSCILNFYFFYGYATVTAELRIYQEKIDQMNELLKSLNEKLRGAVPYMVVEEVSLRFYPAEINRTVSVGNLRKIKVRPVDVVLTFKVKPSTNSSVKFDYYPKTYTINVPREETNYVECPFSIYPIYVANESVSFRVDVSVDVVWKGEKVSRAFTSATLNVEVEED